MKNKFSIVSLVLTVTVLCSMLFQSVHKYEHIATQLAEIHCTHEKKSATEITHQHDGYDFCGICDFKVSSFTFLFPSKISIENFDLVTLKTAVTSSEINSFYKGSLFALRAPPLS